MMKSHILGLSNYLGRQTSIFALILFSSFTVSTSAQAAYVGFLTGDSFSDGAADWPSKVSLGTLYDTAVSGQTLVTMESKFITQLDLYSNAYDIDIAIIQGGLNDIMLDFDLATMQAAVSSMASTTISRDMPLLIMNIAPWTGATTQDKRDEIDTYNGWLDATFGGGALTDVVDIFTLLEDPLNPQYMNPDYALDLIHPNQAGHQLIADAMDSAIVGALVPIPAAAWLFGSGLIGLIGVARRKACA